MLVLLVFAIFWLILSPLLILGKVGDATERLSRRITALEKAIDAMRQGPIPREASKEQPSVTPLSEVQPSADLLSEELPLAPPLPEAPPPVELPVGEAPIDLDLPKVPEVSLEAPEPSESLRETPEEPTVEELPVAAAAAFHPDNPDGPNDDVSLSRQPGSVAAAWSRLLTWLIAEGNIWVCTGVLLFLVGFGLLFSYAVHLGLLTLEMRLAGAAVTGLLMVAFGFRMRLRRRAYALVLQGGGMGVLYLVVLAAAKLHSASTNVPILPEGPAVGAMIFLSVVTVVLALVQDYEPLALFAVLGGFAAPHLLQVGARSPVTLFSICTLLNFEILAIAFRRRWRLLNRMGFLLTAGIALFWGQRNWRPDLFSAVEPFLLAFLATYTLITLRFAMRRAGGESPDAAEASRYDADMPLTVLVPFVFFFLQSRAAGHLAYGTASTCLGLGVWYLIFGVWLRQRGERYQPAVWRLFAALSVLFSNLVLPYAFERVLSSAVWAAEGAFLVVAACRYGSLKALLGGIFLQVGALCLYAPELARIDLTVDSALSPILASGVLFAAALWCSGFWITHFRLREEDLPHGTRWERQASEFLRSNVDSVCVVLSWVLTGAGALWWWGTMGDQVPRVGLPWLSAFPVVCLTALAACWASLRLDWRAAQLLLFGPLIAGILWVFETLPFVLGPVTLDFFGIGRSLTASAVVYVATIGPSLRLLHQTKAGFRGIEIFHFAAILVGLRLADMALEQWGFRWGGDWAQLLSLLPLAVLLLHVSRARERSAFVGSPKSLAFATALPLLLQLPAFVDSFKWKGTAVGGLFVPLLNPLELWQAIFILSCVLWFRCSFVKDGRPSRPLRQGFFGVLFVWVNQVAARAAWWYSDEAFTSIWMVLRTSHCQGIIAILWGVLGLAGILQGKRLRSRSLWRAGAGLLAADMVKLLLVDLNRSATLTRIFAFLVLGGLFLLIGWAAPLPPRETAADRGKE